MIRSMVAPSGDSPLEGGFAPALGRGGGGGIITEAGTSGAGVALRGGGSPAWAAMGEHSQRGA